MWRGELWLQGPSTEVGNKGATGTPVRWGLRPAKSLLDTCQMPATQSARVRDLPLGELGSSPHFPPVPVL